MSILKRIVLVVVSSLIFAVILGLVKSTGMEMTLFDALIGHIDLLV